MPTGIKELEPVEGWPWTEASLVFKDRIATYTSHHIERLLDRGGVVPVGQTTASEFGGLNVSVTKLNGVTHNPWRHGRTVGGSSGGSAAAVAGGLVSLATGGDGGGSIRIPAGYTGLLGMKGTFGRIPRRPARLHAAQHRRRRQPLALGARRGALLRRVRRPAPVRPVEPPVTRRVGGRPRHARPRAASGSRSSPTSAASRSSPASRSSIRTEAKALIAATGMVEVDITVEPPNLPPSG